MSGSDSVPPPPASDAAAPTYSYRNEIVSAKIAQMNESRSELQTRIQSLKQDLQSWRSKLGTQVKIYSDTGRELMISLHVGHVVGEELSQLKTSLNVEVDQLRSEFQDLRTTLHQQQDDVAYSLRNLGLQDASADGNAVNVVKIEGTDETSKGAMDSAAQLNVDDVKPQL